MPKKKSIPEESSRFPEWEKLYEQEAFEKMPWYYHRLDPDLESALNQLEISSGKFLDLGTGSGNQAAHLTRMGFDVTGTDISKTAVLKARERYDFVNFEQDDILKTKVRPKYDYVFDRGCFHIFNEKERKIYATNLSKLLKRGGYFFLKCFSYLEPETGKGPYRMSVDVIKEVFEKDFRILSVKQTVYQGQRNPNPRAMFIVMRKKI